MNATPHTAREKKVQPQAPVKARLLVVEDEQDLRELLQYTLAREGFAVDCVERGEEGIKRIAAQPPDLLLLDLMLPGMDGLAVCRQVKSDAATRHIPIIMLTAKGEEADIVVGLEMGADDYITKPFSPRVLVARIKAALRRPVGGAESETGGTRPLRFDRLEIIPDRHEAIVEGKPADLTATEFRLICLLARRPGRVFTRQQIIDQLHEGFAAVTDRSVDVQVVSLRRKLGAAAEMIQTVRGVGYRFSEERADG